MIHASATSDNAAQIEYWNAAAGETWARFQDRLDHQLRPIGDEALRALDAKPGEAVIDIGCGCGETTFVLADAVGPGGRATGVDVSEPMLAVARARAGSEPSSRATFLAADAQTGELGQRVYDAAFSRFGVMFFADPIAAFANIKAALKPNGRLAFVCWRPLADNIWMRAPMEAAAAHLPPQPPMNPTAPGPFAFADSDRLRGLLAAAGFEDIDIAPFDVMIGGGDIAQTTELAFRVGPLGAALRESPQSVDAVGNALRALYQKHLTKEGVLMPAAVWIVRARPGR